MGQNTWVTNVLCSCGEQRQMVQVTWFQSIWIYQIYNLALLMKLAVPDAFLWEIFSPAQRDPVISILDWNNNLAAIFEAN